VRRSTSHPDRSAGPEQQQAKCVPAKLRRGSIAGGKLRREYHLPACRLLEHLLMKGARHLEVH
jgi:hypothetical protein